MSMSGWRSPKAPTRPGYCSAQSYHDRSGFFPCSNRGKHKEGGKTWCGIHLPSKVKAKDEARRATWQSEWDAREARHEAEEKVREVEGALVDGVLARSHVHKGPALPGWLLDLARKVRLAREGVKDAD